jgi:membrane protease YdiL (CAAX protease family)
MPPIAQNLKRIHQIFVELFNSEKAFFSMAKEGKRITHLAISIPLVVVVILAGVLLSELLLYEIVFQNPELSIPLRKFYSFTVTVSIVIFFLWLWIRFFEKRPLKTIGLRGKNAFKKYLFGFLTGIIMMSAVIGLMKIFGSVSNVKLPVTSSLDEVAVVLLLLAAYIVQGANEEILSRGWQFQVIGARYKPWIGALISSIIFVLLHGFNNGISIISVLNLFLFAFLLILFVLRDNSIWAACGWHSSWNWTMENIFGMNVSGSESVGSILNLSVKGPDFLSGGDFGPEGSVFTTIILFIGISFVIGLIAFKY